jgi:hypothetical protein
MLLQDEFSSCEMSLRAEDIVESSLFLFLLKIVDVLSLDFGSLLVDQVVVGLFNI